MLKKKILGCFENITLYRSPPVLLSVGDSITQSFSDFSRHIIVDKSQYKQKLLSKRSVSGLPLKMFAQHLKQHLCFFVDIETSSRIDQHAIQKKQISLTRNCGLI